ncbi:AAA family ATPase [Endozoicomonas atrinae]|uniref:AAA family ATPase n=1 Tax=Endozoicomonas atrinae TaxID=1333660 RepID=UPI003B00B7E0
MKRWQNNIPEYLISPLTTGFRKISIGVVKDRYIFSGLPASGKSTLAQLLSKHLTAMYIRIDTIEQGLRDLCSLKVEGESYDHFWCLKRKTGGVPCQKHS